MTNQSVDSSVISILSIYLVNTEYSWLVPFIVTLPLFLFLWTKLKEWWLCDKRNYILVEYIANQGYGNNNFLWTAICWYMVEHDIVSRSLICRSTESTPFNKIKLTEFNSHEPIYIPTGKFSFDYESCNMNVVFNNADKSSCAYFYGDIHKVKIFLQKCLVLYERHVYVSPNDGKVHIFSWKGGIWMKRLLNINKSFKNVFIPEQTRKLLMTNIEEFESDVNEQFYKSMGIPYKRGYMFYGIPGTGKSSTVFAIANEYNRNIYKVSPKNLPENDFRNAMSLIPPKSLLLIEEIDIQVSSNTSKGNLVDLSTILDVLDGYDYLHNVIIVITSNHRKDLNDAMIRPGRIDVKINFGKIEKEDIQHIIHAISGYNIKVSSNISITSSELINEIVLPNRKNEKKIIELLEQLNT